MLPPNPTNIVITGVHYPIVSAYKRADGTEVSIPDYQFSSYVLAPNGELEQAGIVGVVEKTPKTFVYSVASPVGKAHVSGTVVPANASVKVSTYTAPSDRWAEELVANKLADIPTNEYGEFSVSFIDCEEDMLFWCEVPSNFGSMGYSIKLNVAQGLGVDDESTEQYLIQHAYKCGDYNATGATGTPTFTISGTCPEDAAQVFISTQPGEIPEGSDNVTELTNRVLYSAIPESGAYSVKFSTALDGYSIVAWCISEIVDSAITISYTVDTGSITEVCLSGDTPILLYDGTQKALRDLTVDDVLMAGDHTPTRITKITRGIVSDYHTLYLFEDGSIIDEAHRHRFYNVDAGCWMYLDEWKIGNRAQRCDGSTPKLIRVERVDEPCRRHGLWTESRDYYAGNLLSGETAANQSVLANATLEQAAELMATIEADKLNKLYEGVLG